MHAKGAGYEDLVSTRSHSARNRHDRNLRDADLTSTVASTLAALHLPEAGGTFGVGKIATILEDIDRPEPASPAADDHRRVRVVAWYPAEARTGRPASYVFDLDGIADALVASGEISGFAVAGLTMVSDSARAGATAAAVNDRYPVIILSPGNATNVEFYGALAEELASGRLDLERSA